VNGYLSYLITFAELGLRFGKVIPDLTPWDRLRVCPLRRKPLLFSLDSLVEESIIKSVLLILSLDTIS